VDLTIELTDSTDGYYEASCPELGLVARAASLEAALGRVSRLIVYAATSLEEMPLSVTDWQEGIERLGASTAGRNFCMPRYPKIH
jgi:predicted RNase H-like HicB family nuclease